MPIADALLLKTAANAFQQISPSLLSGIGRGIKSASDELRVKYTLTFQSHLQKSLRKCLHVKTLVSRDEPIDIHQIYVNLFVERDGNLIDDAALLASIVEGARIVIAGTGGAGKTMLMKHLLVSTVQNPKGIIPLFIELRSLTFSAEKSLGELIFSYITERGSDESYSLLSEGLKQGLFVVFLDGLDEIPENGRALAFEKIIAFSEKFPKAAIVISSRPGVAPQSFEAFSVLHLQPLTLEQAISVVQKTPFDAEVKEKFLLMLTPAFYKQQSTFLKIPLLVVMMLLTFGSYADIPDKMSVFYEQAFETLYSLHDSRSKGVFKRRHVSGLTPDVFKRMFEAFCYITFSRHKLEFLHSELIDNISNALKVCSVDADPHKIRHDLEESVCLLYIDGVKYLFSHRSFQEYFAAKFALRYSGANQFEIIQNCIGRPYESSVARLMQEIDPIRFREAWIKPALEKVLESLSKSENQSIASRLAELFDHMEAFPSGSVAGHGWTGLREANEYLAHLSILLDPMLNVFMVLRNARFYSEEYASVDHMNKAIGPLPGQVPEFIKFAATASEDEQFRIEIAADNEEWFGAAGIQKRLDDLLLLVRGKLAEVTAACDAQRRVELEIL